MEERERDQFYIPENRKKKEEEKMDVLLPKLGL